MRFIYVVIFFTLCSSVFASEAALIKKLKGTAYVIRDGKEIVINVGTKVFEKDVIFTNSKSNLSLIFKDNTRISLGAKSQLSISEYIFKPNEKKESLLLIL